MSSHGDLGLSLCLCLCAVRLFQFFKHDLHAIFHAPGYEVVPGSNPRSEAECLVKNTKGFLILGQTFPGYLLFGWSRLKHQNNKFGFYPSMEGFFFIFLSFLTAQFFCPPVPFFIMYSAVLLLTYAIFSQAVPSCFLKLFLAVF